MPFSRKLMPLTTQFFQLLMQRNFSGAERTIERIKEGTRATEWYRGYVKALEGMIIALKSNDDRYVFISRIDSERIEKLKKEFTRYSRSPLYADFDRGFFAAWAEYVRILNEVQLKAGDQAVDPSLESPKENNVSNQSKLYKEESRS